MCTGDNTLYVQYVRKYIYKLYRCFLVLHYLHISSVPLVLHWCWIGEHFCKHLSQTLCALHTSHCTLLASLLQNPVCSSNRRHFSYATLPFTILTEVLPERRTRMRLLTNEKDLWEKVQQSWEFSKGGMSSTFCSSHISKAEFIFSASPKTQLLSAASSCNFPSSQSNALRGKAFPGKVLFSQKNVLFTGLSGSGWVKSMALKV